MQGNGGAFTIRIKQKPVHFCQGPGSNCPETDSVIALSIVYMKQSIMLLLGLSDLSIAQRSSLNCAFQVITPAQFPHSSFACGGAGGTLSVKKRKRTANYGTRAGAWPTTLHPFRQHQYKEHVDAVNDTC